MTRRRRAFGHGKVILLGEHAVVYGQPALAAGLSVGVWADARRRQRAAHGAGVGARGARERWPAGGGFRGDPGIFHAGELDVRWAALPTRAGLGSSAAISIAVARARRAPRRRGPMPRVARRGRRRRRWSFMGRLRGSTRPRPRRRGGTLSARQGLAAGGGAATDDHLRGALRRAARHRAQVDAVGSLRERAPIVGKVIALLGGGGGAASGAGARRHRRARPPARRGPRSAGGAAGLLAELDALVHGARAAGAVAPSSPARGAAAR